MPYIRLKLREAQYHSRSEYNWKKPLLSIGQKRSFSMKPPLMGLMKKWRRCADEGMRTGEMWAGDFTSSGGTAAVFIKPSGWLHQAQSAVFILIQLVFAFLTPFLSCGKLKSRGESYAQRPVICTVYGLFGLHVLHIIAAARLLF